MDLKRQQRAAATAAEYDQGSIAGLDDAMTRRLIGSTVYTESNGGDLGITNRQGYVGRYQAGAQWLADAGYVDRQKLAGALKGQGSEWAWAQAGGMTRFLRDSSNWNDGLSLEQYQASGALQDRAFKHICDATYMHALQKGALHSDDEPRRVAGFLKARHIAGYGGAVAVLEGKPPRFDSNGTSNYDYFNDIATNRDGLDRVMHASERRVARSSVPNAPARGVESLARHAASDHHAELKAGVRGVEVERLQLALRRLGVPDAHGRPLATDGDFSDRTREAVKTFQRTHDLAADGVVGPVTRAALGKAEHSLLTHPGHPHHALFNQSLEGVNRAEAARGIAHGPHSEHVAGAVAAQAVRDGLQRVDRVEFSSSGEKVRAVQVHPLRDEPGLNTATQPLETRDAVQQSLHASSTLADQAQAVHQQRVEQQSQHLSQPHARNMQGLAPAL